MTRGTLLAAFAHPDDETFGPGGTLALYALRGYTVHLICATRGEAGSLAPGMRATIDLGALRVAELRCAIQALGIHHLHLLGYRDSGMPGSPDHEHPAAFIRAPFEEVVHQLVALIREIRPDVVLTFDPYGFTCIGRCAKPLSGRGTPMYSQSTGPEVCSRIARRVYTTRCVTIQPGHIGFGALTKRRNSPTPLPPPSPRPEGPWGGGRKNILGAEPRAEGARLGPQSPQEEAVDTC